MKSIRTLTLIAAALALLALTGCKQADVRRSRGGASEADAATQAALAELLDAENRAARADATDPAAAEAPPVPNSITAPNHAELLERQEGDLIEIDERLFIALTNDIYLNAQDYLGKTLRYEGIYQCDVLAGDDGAELVHYVIRYGPGCCGYDDNAGFEVVWNGTYPQADEWVEAVGVLEEFEQDGWKYLRVNLESLTVLDVRGAEYVSQ